METLNPSEKIYCPELDDIKINSSAEYLIQYHLLGSPETYWEDGTIQCDANRRRSLTDLYLLLRTKYPEYTYTQLGIDLYYLAQHLGVNKNLNLGFRIFFCNNINKLVVSNRYSYMSRHWGDIQYSYEKILEISSVSVEDSEYHTLVKNLIAITKGYNPEILLPPPTYTFLSSILTEK